MLLTLLMLMAMIEIKITKIIAERTVSILITEMMMSVMMSMMMGTDEDDYFSLSLSQVCCSDPAGGARRSPHLPRLR